MSTPIRWWVWRPLAEGEPAPAVAAPEGFTPRAMGVVEGETTLWSVQQALRLVGVFGELGDHAVVHDVLLVPIGVPDTFPPIPGMTPEAARAGVRSIAATLRGEEPPRSRDQEPA